MIDWLDVEIAFQHRPIQQGRRIILSPDGDIQFQSPILRSVENDFDSEGSYSSSIAVSSIENDYLADFFKGYRQDGNKAYGLSIKGNPTKYLQGHNIFGIDCIRTLLIRTIKDIFPKLGFSEFEQHLVINSIHNWRFAVTRIDITKMFNLGSDAAVNEYLQMLPRTVKARGDRTDFVKNTFYIGRNSGLWSFKFYNKFKEISSASKKHKLPDFLPETLKDFVRGQLRAELVLRKKALNRLNMTYSPQILQAEINNLFNAYAERMEMKNQTISDIDMSNLSAAYLGTIMLWKQGKHMKSVLTHDTYYRHRRKLLELGIDIAKPPIALDERIAIVKPLKVLAPKEITQIPVEFVPYQVKLAV